MKWWHWLIVVVIAILIFRSVGAANAGSSAGHGAQNVGQFITSFFKAL